MNTIDENVIKLLHYFITIKGYNPVILHGAENEFWLENLDEDYKIVRIVNNYIHNNEQLKFDLFRTKQIVKKIKKQTFTVNMNVLSIFLNLGDNVSTDKFDGSNMVVVGAPSVEELKKKKKVTDYFPDICSSDDYDETGINLFINLTKDINRKNEQNNDMANDIFRMKKPYVTLVILSINIIVFLLMYIFGKGSGDVKTLVDFGALYKPLVKDGQFYRLFTCAFLHIGIIHLFVNSYSLFVIGTQLESFLGKFKFIFVYIVSAMCGSLMSIVFSSTVSVGASGAIFGLLGSLMYFGYNYRVYLGNVLKTQIVPLLILNLGLGFFVGGVDNAAHIGGLIGGILATIAVGLKYKTSNFERINGAIILAIYIVFLGYMGFVR